MPSACRSAATTTGAELHDALAALGARLILAALDGVAGGRLVPQPQPAMGVTYAKKLRREEGALDWRQPAAALERAVRAFDPWPGAFFEHQGERIKVLAAALAAASAGAAPGTVLDDRLAIALRRGRAASAGRCSVPGRAAASGGRVSARISHPRRHPIAMPRYKLTLEYDGAGLVGWQRQANGLSVQEVLEQAVERFCGEPRHRPWRRAAPTPASTRSGQAAHLDLPKEASCDVIRKRAQPPREAGVRWPCSPSSGSPTSFDARRSARGRVYLYRILNRRPPAVLERGRVWHVGPRLDAEAMQEAARLLVGKHDFTSFRDTLCQAKSPVKTLDRLDVARTGDEIRIEARSALVPASPGAQHGGHAEAGGRRQVAGGDVAARAGRARPPRRRPDRAARRPLSRRGQLRGAMSAH